MAKRSLLAPLRAAITTNTRIPLIYYNRRKNTKQMDNGDHSSYNWFPDLLISRCTVGKGHACMVLNRKINIHPKLTQQLWQNAHVRCLVDGGSNRWRQFLQTHCKGLDLKTPDLITGDFDSITDETWKFFNDATTLKVHTPDQNATDFTKAVEVVQPLLAEKQLNDIIVLHDTSGRLDQIMANINTLHEVQSEKLNVYLLCGNSLAWLLLPGKHSIKVPNELVQQERWCALMPIGSPACVTTTGLKWNLTNTKMQFGGMVSTSNTYASEQITVETDTCLLWSMGLFSFEDD